MSSTPNSTPTPTTPTTAPCSPQEYEMAFPESPEVSGISDCGPIHELECNCGCVPSCVCPLHFGDYVKAKTTVKEMEVDIAYHNNFTGWPIKNEEDLPQWMKKTIEEKQFEVWGYGDQEYATNVPWSEMSDLFETRDWNNHYSIINNYKKDILSLIPARVRILPQCYSNGAILVLLATWADTLSKIIKTIIAGQFDIHEELERCQIYQDVHIYEWSWKMFFDYENCPEVIVDDEGLRKKKRILWFLGTTTTSYIHFISEEAGCAGFNKNPFTRRSDAQVFISSRFSRDYQEALFENYALQIKRARAALNACGYDYITRSDIDVKKLHSYRAGCGGIFKWLVPYCGKSGGTVLNFAKEKRKVISASQMVLYTLEQFDENHCMCPKNCVDRLIRGNIEFTPCWDRERALIKRRCKVDLRFTRTKRAKRPEDDNDVPELECFPPPRKQQKKE